MTAISSRISELAGVLASKGLHAEAELARGLAEEVADNRMLTIEEAAEFLKLPAAEVVEAIKRRELPCVRIGQALRIHIRSVIEANLRNF